MHMYTHARVHTHVYSKREGDGNEREEEKANLQSSTELNFQQKINT